MLVNCQIYQSRSKLSVPTTFELFDCKGWKYCWLNKYFLTSLLICRETILQRH